MSTTQRISAKLTVERVELLLEPLVGGQPKIFHYGASPNFVETLEIRAEPESRPVDVAVFR